MRSSGATLISLIGLISINAWSGQSVINRSTASLPGLSTLKNWGLSNDKPLKSHISAVDAWKIEEGSRQITVAVIDTGIDPKHPLLRDNLWSDPHSKTPVHGWDFVNNTPNPIDLHGHGTHVAGIIGAIADSKTGISGVAHKVSIMPVKYYSETSSGKVNLANSVKAIEYAVKNGAQIINISGGGPDRSEEEYLALRKAEAAGILVIAAAGNESRNTDKSENYYYPAAYGLSNIISVAATDIQNELLPSSNWGKKGVDVAAPGSNILSTYPTQMLPPKKDQSPGVFYMSGTSQATAFVSGLAVLLLAQDSSLTPAQIKEIIIESSDKLPQLAGRLKSGGRVNALSALVALKSRMQKNMRKLAGQDSAPKRFTQNLLNLLPTDKQPE